MTHGNHGRRNRPGHLPPVHLVPDITEHGFTFNQFLLSGDEPFLFHTGMRAAVPAGVRGGQPDHPARDAALDLVRSRRGRRVRRDEPCSSPAAPNAEVVHGALACMLSLNDLGDRPPVSHRRTTRCSTSADTGCGSSPRRTCRTTGRAGCGSTRPPPRCSPATCSPTSASARRHRVRHRRAGVGGGGDLPRDVALTRTWLRRSDSSPR